MNVILGTRAEMLMFWGCPIKANVDILIVVFYILCFNGGAYHKNVWRHINIIFLMKSAIKRLFCKVCDVAIQVSSVQQLPAARDGPGAAGAGAQV